MSYGVTPSDERLDFDQIRDLARAQRPKMIVAGATAYSRIIDPEPFREIADEVGALFMFDAAHIAGLIAGGVHPNPVPYADIVTFTTHKTLRGPRGGCILSTAEHGQAIDKAVFPGLQGGPLDHVIAAKAVAFREAAHPSSRTTPPRSCATRSALAAALAGRGLPPGVGRHRQPPHARRPAHRSTPTSPARRPAWCSTGPASRLNENTDPRRSAPALRHQRPAHRHARRSPPRACGEPEMRQIAELIAPGAARAATTTRELAAVRDEVADALLQVHALPATSMHRAPSS